MNAKSSAAALAALIVLAAPLATSPALAREQCETTAKPKKKKGLGLGGILSAARQAGLGEILEPGKVLGNDKAAGLAGSVAGSIVNDGRVDPRAVGTAVAGNGRAAQVAGVVASTVAGLASGATSAPRQEAPANRCQAPPTRPTEPSKAWN